MSEHLRIARARWIWPTVHSTLLEWTRDEVAGIVQMLSDEVIPAAEKPSTVIVVGTGAFTRLGQVAGIDIPHHALSAIRDEGIRLETEEYLIRMLDNGSGTRFLVIAGGSESALAWACFELLEQLGCRFRISGDSIPARTNPIVPNLNIRRAPAHKVRGVWFSYCFATNSIMSLTDYRSMFAQMVKLKLNRFLTYHFENEPFIDFSFRGERKLVGDVSHPTSSYISYGRHFSGSYLTKDVPIGSELFGRERVAPQELQHVASSDEALDEGVRFMRSIYRMARQFGLEPWLAFIPSFIPMNFAKYARKMPRPHMHWSSLVSFTDPVVDEMNKKRIESIIEDYPDLGGVFLGIPEGYYEDPYPESKAILDEKRSRYTEALDLHKRLWGDYWNNDAELLEAHIDRDIGFVELLKRTIDIVRGVAPELSIGVMTVCKAYLLTVLDEDLPKDISFADIESRSLWTKDGAPLHLFDRMKGRECSIIPRAVDDGSMAGLQHNLELYDLDGFLQSPIEHGTSGLIIQTTHIRGNEHNFGYLAKGMWHPELKPERFYRNYTTGLFGKEAGEHVYRAFKTLETNEQELGGRGQGNLPWNKVPSHIEVLRRFEHYPMPLSGVPYDDGFVSGLAAKSVYYVKAVEHLERAAEEFEGAARILDTRTSFGVESDSSAVDRPIAPRDAVAEIVYLISKNAAYRYHLLALIELGSVYADLKDALSKNGADVTLMALEAVARRSDRAASLAESSARDFARSVDHPTDLGVLWSINTSMVIGTRVLRTYITNLVRYYRGEEYWEPIPWRSLFDNCPYPAYTLAEMSLTPELSTDANREYEPG